MWAAQIPRQEVGLFDPPEEQKACFAGPGNPLFPPWAAVVGVFARRHGAGSGVFAGHQWTPGCW